MLSATLRRASSALGKRCLSTSASQAAPRVAQRALIGGFAAATGAIATYTLTQPPQVAESKPARESCAHEKEEPLSRKRRAHHVHQIR